MPRTPEEAPTAFSRAVAQGIADAMDEAGVTQAAVARMTGLSTNYLNERMRLVKSFTLSDVDKIAAALRFNPSRFLLGVDARMRDVSTSVEDLSTDDLTVIPRTELQQRDLTLAADRDPAPRAVDEPAADEDQGDADNGDDDESAAR